MGSQEIETAVCSLYQTMSARCLFSFVMIDKSNHLLCSVRYRERLVIIVCWLASVRFGNLEILKWEYTSSTHILYLASRAFDFLLCDHFAMSLFVCDYEHIIAFNMHLYTFIYILNISLPMPHDGSFCVATEFIPSIFIPIYSNIHTYIHTYR